MTICPESPENEGAVAWLHDERPDSDAITDTVKRLWLRVRPAMVEHYTIPLYRRAT